MKLIKSILLVLAITFFSASSLLAGGNAEIGKKIFMSKKSKNGITAGNCIACHDVSGEKIEQPGTVGPKLAYLSAWPKQALYDRLYDPTTINPISAMPPFGANALLDEDELQDVVAYLKTIN
jgi:sulfur-oxidizing protein SoxX